jgi:carboxyl-terminal processing protease
MPFPAQSSAELDEIWRKRVKNDALNLAIEDEPWEKIQEVLTKRYEGYLRRLNQTKNEDVFERFMNSFVHALDPHSSYLSPRNAEEYRMQMSLSYFGIGASLQTEDEYVKIAGIIPGGPAAIDGSLQPEDRITGVGQGAEAEVVDVIGWRLDDVVDLIRGPADSVVRLEIIPANSPRNHSCQLSAGQSQKIHRSDSRTGQTRGTGGKERDRYRASRWTRVVDWRDRRTKLLPRLSSAEQRRQKLYKYNQRRKTPHC